MQASLLLPMGRLGPAFLAYPNFGVYTQWNRSLVYATTAAYFATRLAGAPPVQKGSAQAPPATRSRTCSSAWKRAASTSASVDGALGAQTRAAVKAVQSSSACRRIPIPTRHSSPRSAGCEADPQWLDRIGSKRPSLAGAPFESAVAAMILVHGRGATAESILPLADAFGRDDIAYVAPRARRTPGIPTRSSRRSRRTSRGSPRRWRCSRNSWISSRPRGFPPERIGILGFSQGACLPPSSSRATPAATALAGRPHRRADRPAGHAARLSRARSHGTPVFLGCSDIDPHVPLERVDETRDVLTASAARSTSGSIPAWATR